MNQRDRQAYKDWEKFRENIMRATDVDFDEHPAVQEVRKKELLQDITAFAKYYFPHYCTADFAKFHKRMFSEVTRNKRIYLVMEVAREHAKSVTAGVILPLYLMCKKELFNMLLVSYNETNAKELLRPIKLELESNQRLIHDFGKQVSLSNWEDGKFITMNGVSFRAIGSGQSPRGSRNQESRPDFILCDDIDEDEQSRSPKRVSDAFDWVNGALFGCLSIEHGGRFLIVGNRIAQDTVLGRCVEKADTHIKANIYDDSGNVSWKERYTKAMCEYMIGKMGYRLSQREYFNNPISEGKVFKKEWFQYKKLPPLNAYKFLVAYLDPGFKKTATSDSKALVLVGLHNGDFHIRKVFCGKASVEEMIEWCYEMFYYVKRGSGAYIFKMEEVFLQSLLYKDFNAAGKTKGLQLPVSGDTRKKPDKDARIEAMSGYFERGNVFIDEDIEADHHCRALVEQFLNFEPKIKTLKDGPDATEGAFHILQQALTLNINIGIGSKHKSKHKM